MVRAKGVEPSLPREPEPKSGASTNSATRASKKTLIKWVDSFLNTPPRHPFVLLFVELLLHVIHFNSE